MTPKWSHNLSSVSLGLSTVSCPGISITASPYRSQTRWLAAAILKYRLISLSRFVVLFICSGKENKKINNAIDHQSIFAGVTVSILRFQIKTESARTPVYQTFLHLIQFKLLCYCFKYLINEFY